MKTKPKNHLPNSPQQRREIIKKIENQLINLENENRQNAEDMKLVIKNDQNIDILRLRRKLIVKCGELSLIRLNHLQQVFKHYCTHIFKTGKHMTFDRLEYEKVHMTMDRFFLFLRDFQLTMASIQEKKRQVIQKPNIVTIFKRISSNARELSFQQFIQCIQKLALLYWEEKLRYTDKRKQYEERMKKIKKENQRRRKKKMGEAISSSQEDKDESQDKSGEQSNEEGQQSEKEKQKEEEDENEQESNKEDKKAETPQNNQNDDLVDDLMNDQDLEDPNQEVRQVAQKAKRENEAVQSVKKLQKDEFEALLKFSDEQKIEFYYQLLQIDSIQSYKKKLTELNLANYIVHKKGPKQNEIKSLSESKLEAALQQEERLLKLKAKMNEQKSKKKERPLPKPSDEKARKEQQNAQRRRQMKKQREMAVKQLKNEQIKQQEKKLKNPTPKIQYRQGQATLSMLQKLTIDHLKLKNFNPSKYYTIQDEDRYFLDEYGGAKPKLSQRFQARQRQSQSIVQSTKMRAKELQKSENLKGSMTQRNQVRQNKSFSRNNI